MSGVLKPRLEIFPPAQRKLWPQLKAATDQGFVLYGGTAIALRLGHRTSIDFDFFSDNPLDRVAIDAAFPFMAKATVLQDQRDTLTVSIPVGDSAQGNVKLSFFGSIGFGRVGTPDMTDDGVLQVVAAEQTPTGRVNSG